MTKQEIKDYYEGTGYNTDDTAKHLKSKTLNGYDESYDKSLSIIPFPTFIVVIGVGGLSYYDRRI